MATTTLCFAFKNDDGLTDEEAAQILTEIMTDAHRNDSNAVNDEDDDDNSSTLTQRANTPTSSAMGSPPATDTDNNQQPPTMSNMATGTKRPDQYWRIISHKADHVEMDIEGKLTTVAPVTIHECDLDAYKWAPRTHAQFLEDGVYDITPERIHGRRFNDEVELFLNEDGEETPGLREQMEKKGLTVRTYAPKVQNRFPMSKVVFQKVKSYLEKCADAFYAAVVVKENDTDEPTPYAILAHALKGPSVYKAGRKRPLIGFVCNHARFSAIMRDDQSRITVDGVDYPTLGYYHDERTYFWAEEKTLKEFFGAGGERLDVHWIDDVKREAEKARAEKKQAKKQRRALATPAFGRLETVQEEAEEKADEEGEEDSQVSQPVDEVKRAKKEKDKKKKKAQKARRKAKQEQAEALVAAEEKRNQSIADRSDAVFNPSLGLLDKLSQKDFGQSPRGRKTGVAGAGAGAGAGEGFSETDEDDEDGHSDGGVGRGELEGRVRVVHVERSEDIDEALAAAEGPVLVASMQDLDLELGRDPRRLEQHGTSD